MGGTIGSFKELQIHFLLSRLFQMFSEPWDSVWGRLLSKAIRQATAESLNSLSDMDAGFQLQRIATRIIMRSYQTHSFCHEIRYIHVIIAILFKQLFPQEDLLFTHYLLY